MKQFFYPGSVAIIGVSERKNNLARNIINNCLEFGFRGDIYGVGRRAGHVSGIPIQSSIESLPHSIDLAIILTPAQTIAGIMAELGKIGVKRIIIETGGFSEFEPARQGLEAEILDVASRYDQRFIGPNCLGVINMETGLCTPFAPYRRDMPIGKVSIISQSGGMGRTFFSILESEAIGVNKFVSVGNKLDVDETELLQYFLDDPTTNVIFLYLEDIREGRDFLQTACSSKKPILVHKASRGQMGSSIALSHTKALTTNNQLLGSALQEAGIVRVEKTYELAKALKAFHMPALKGPNLMVISRSGGHAVVAADACETEGLCLPPLPHELQNRLERHLRANVIRLQNPLDMGDIYDIDVFAMAIEESLKQDSIHGVLLIFPYADFVRGQRQQVRKIIPHLERLIKQYQKPIGTTFISSSEEQKELNRRFNLPIFSSSEEAVEALGISYRYHCEEKNRKTLSTTLKASSTFEKSAKKQSNERKNLSLNEALGLVERGTLPVPPFQAVENTAQALNFARKVGLPVALKIASKKILHKTRNHGVRLHLNTYSEIRKVFAEMKRKIADEGLEDQGEGLLIQKMVPSGLEVILGARRDPSFGPVLILGLGGVFTEAFGDVAISLAPIDELRANEMVKRVKFFSTLTATNSTPGLDLKMIEKCLIKVSDLITAHQEIAELDINPLIVHSDGAHIVDARIILG